MRRLILPLICWPGLAGLAMAEEFAVSAPVTSVVLHAGGGTVEREVVLQVPAGAHRLVVQDLPVGTDLAALRLHLEGAQKGEVVMRQRFTPPRDALSAEVAAAEAEVERIAEEIAGVQDARAVVLSARDAGEARLAYLARLGDGEAPAAEAVAGLVSVIAKEVAEARQQIVAAEAEARGFAGQLRDLREALARAEARLAALRPEDEERAYVAVGITAPEARELRLTLRQFDPNMSWAPVYDIRLDRASGAMRLERGAYIQQETGENWQGVQVTLSTARPMGQIAARELYPQRLVMADPAPQPKAVMRSLGDAAMAPPMIEPSVMAESVAEMDFDGLVAEYRYDRALTLASGADVVRVALGEAALSAEVQAVAVPRYDDSAYLEARAENSAGQPLIPGVAFLYRDGRYIGQTELGSIPAGGELRLGFGPIEGLRLTRTVLDRQEGDRGVISKSNAREERVRIGVENLTAEDWPLRLIDRVPYSEQEDLQITYQASPAPSETDMEGRRGLLGWDMRIGAGQKAQIRLDSTIKWPEGKVIR